MYLAACFRESARRFPERPALVLEGQTLSYRDLSGKAARIARTIERHDRDPSGFVGVLAHRSLSAYAGVLGALSAGCAYVPLHPQFPLERTRRMCAASRLTTIVAGAEAIERLRELLPAAEVPLLILLPECLAAPPWTNDFPEHRFRALPQMVDDSSLPSPEGSQENAYLLFTSGSTGHPKGVAVSHGNVRAYVEYLAERYEVTERDKFSQFFDLTFDLSVHDLFVCWARGASLHVLPHEAVLAPARFVRDRALTMWFSVPSAVNRMKALRMLRPGIFPSLRVSLFCGEPLPKSHAEDWSQAAPGSVVENLYGPTEATIGITHYRWTSSSGADCVNGIVPIGRPFEGQRTLVVDEEGRAVPRGEKGELCLSGSQVTAGYLHDPEKTCRVTSRVCPTTTTFGTARVTSFVRPIAPDSCISGESITK